MTNALLTVNDVKNFIMEAITLQKGDVILTTKQLSEELKISTYCIQQYVKQGMPYSEKKHRRTYILNHVKQWMISNNKNPWSHWSKHKLK